MLVKKGGKYKNYDFFFNRIRYGDTLNSLGASVFVFPILH